MEDTPPLLPVNGIVIRMLIPSDEQLVQRARTHDTQAIAALYDRYVSALYRFCMYQLHDTSVAQDLTQDVFIDMIHSLPTFRGTGSFKNWLYTIAKRKVLGFLKEKYQLPKSSLGDWIPDSSNDAWIDPDETRQTQQKESAVQKLLHLLTAPERKAIELVYLHNYTSKEAARVTGRTPESIRVLVHRAIKKLARLHQRPPKKETI